MNNINNSFTKNYNKAVAKSANIVQGAKYRFTILSPRLIRLEYSKEGNFINNPSSLVVFRDFDSNKYNVTESQILLEIKTAYFTLTYVKDKPFKVGKIAGSSTLKVVLNGTDKEWYYGHPEVRNYGGSSFSLENITNNFKLDKGLYSIDGFVSIDDSNSMILNENGFYTNREGNNIDIYLFMYKRDFGLCLDDYYKLTSYPSMVPRYALGAWWYKNEEYNAVDIVNVVKKFKENEIPISIFLLGDKWHKDPNNYEIDKITLGSGREVANYLYQNKIRLGLTINPSLGINVNDSKYPHVSQLLNTTKDINLVPLDSNKMLVFYNNYISSLEQVGVSLFNIDYNNKNDKNTLWLLQHYLYTSSQKYGNGLILSLNSGIAPHRYPVMYTGKTNISWNILNILPFYNLSCANIGVSFVAHAIGGYHNGIENNELYIRYIQFGTFSPIFILASEGGKYYKREPWKWNSLILSVIKKYMKLRNALVPYLYSEGHYYAVSGKTIIKPLYYMEPKIYDEPLYRNQYYFTSQMLIAPITKKKNSVMNRVVQKLYIPNGTWYDYFTGKKYNGGKYYTSFYKDEDYPVFCTAGTILPLSLNDDTDIPDKLEIQIFPGMDNTYNFYEDNNNVHLTTEISYKYQKDNYKLSLKPKEGNASILPSRKYVFRFKNIKLTESISVTYNNSPYQFRSYSDRNDLIIELERVSTAGIIEVSISGINTEISIERVINEEIASILEDLEITTSLKEDIDKIIFSDLSVKKKRIAIRKLRKKNLESKFITMFISLLEYIEN